MKQSKKILSTLFLFLLISCVTAQRNKNDTPDEQLLKEEQTLEMFPDYEPKLTEDTLTDYRPSLASQVALLPEAQEANLGTLVGLLEEYKKKAIGNPGRFEKGQVMLGADMDQYVPSDEECLVSEIGDRIQAVTSEMSPAKIRLVLSQQKRKINEISYNKITYRHADVMGSGRFFYAHEPFTVVILK
jgi:hypothetical protein